MPPTGFAVDGLQFAGVVAQSGSCLRGRQGERHHCPEDRSQVVQLFWGDRVSRFRDPFGHLWWIHQRVAEPTEEEMGQRLNDPEFVKAMEYVQSAKFFPNR